MRELLRRWPWALLLALWSWPIMSLRAATSLDDVRARLRGGEPTRIVCFGDSITGAYYHTGSRRAWCEVLGIALREALPGARPEMINAGISGHTTVNALARLEQDVLARQPHLVVVMFGMNDVTRVPIDEFRGNLRAIVEGCQQANTAVLLCSPNSVVENAARPNAGLQEFAQAVREVAGDAGCEFVDVFNAWQQARAQDEQAWRLEMSDEIHPNMNGHRRLAELVAATLTGREVKLTELPPPADSLQHVRGRLARGESVHIVAMPPYGEIMVDVLRREFPAAELRLTAWPTAGRSLAQMSEWGRQVRALQPDLVIPAVPLQTGAPDPAAFIRDYEWILNHAFPFGGAGWDVVPILPLEPQAALAAAGDELELARTLVVGKDVAFVERRPGDERSPTELVAAWVASQRRVGESKCHFTEQPIVIDGRLDDAAWREAELIAGFYLPWLGRAAPTARRATRARLLWNRAYLYFSADMDDRDLFADLVEHDGDIWNNDVFELFFQPAADKPGYFEFEINAAGTVFDMFVPARTGSIAGLRRAHPFHVEARVAHRGTLNQRTDLDQGWTVEGRIPWSDFLPAGGRPQVDERWKFALCRYDYDRQRLEPELSTSAPLNSLTYANFHHHEDYSTLHFVGPRLAAEAELAADSSAGQTRLRTLKEQLAQVPSRVSGTPDPPPPYRVARVWPQLQTPFPIFAMREPNSRRFLIIDQQAAYGAARLCRTSDTPEDGRLEVLLEFPAEGVAYSLCFHPQFADNGYVYIGWNVTGADGEKWSRVTRYTMARQPPFAFDETSARTIIEWPSNGHNGAAVAFGLDGLLYVTSGDGTSDSDTNLKGQGLDHLLAKVLRIDVDHIAGDQMYSIPADNPFVGQPDVRGETYAYGLRNPWRITVDAETGDVWVGNNGQDLWEQAYRLEPGANYGWSVMEGSHVFYANRQLGPTPAVKPTVEHPHSEARSLTGGVVYYGQRYPALRGAYIYGDYSTGKIWGARVTAGKVVWHRELADSALQISAFAADADGELLILDHRGDGGFYALELNTDKQAADFPKTLTATGLFASVPEHRLHPGAIPYDVIAPLWSDGAYKERYLVLPAGAEQPARPQPIDFTLSKGWNFPDRTVIVKSFATENNADRRWIETRLLVKQQGEWQGYSYRWNEEQTEAVLVESGGRDETFTDAERRPAAWRYPSRTECMVCHSRAANFILGLSTVQLNREFDYGGLVLNQLRVLEWLGALRVNWQAEVQAAARTAAQAAGTSDSDFQAAWRMRVSSGQEQREPAASNLLFALPEDYPRLVDPYAETADLTLRARSYLHANCAQCHVGAGGGNAQLELDFATPLEQTKLLDARPLHHSFGLEDPRVVAPGHPERSVLLHRLAIRSAGQMPQLATGVVDAQAVELFRRWIAQLPEEPRK